MAWQSLRIEISVCFYRFRLPREIRSMAIRRVNNENTSDVNILWTRKKRGTSSGIEGKIFKSSSL